MSDIVERLNLEHDARLACGQDWADLLLVAAGEIERLRARVAELEHTLKDVAVVAHFGGLVRMMEPEALVVIRKLTIAHSGGLDHGDKSVVARLVKVRGR